MSLALRILLSVPVWLVRIILIFLPLAILGFIVIPLAICAGSYRMRLSHYFTREVLQFPWWASLWSNAEDGVDGLRGGDPAQTWWAEKTKGWPTAKRIFIWSALRNPVNNLRYVPLLTPKFRPSRIYSIGLDHEMQDGEGGWYFAWQGIYSCLRYETAHFRFWIGWCFKPEDSKGIEATDTRLPRADFKLQLKRIG